MNGVEWADVGVSTHLKFKVPSYTLKNTVKPNFIPSEVRYFRTKALGFTLSLVDVARMEKISFFYDFHGCGGIRSTQPTVLRYHDQFFLKLTPMDGTARNPIIVLSKLSRFVSDIL